jgi:hypothetical protein
MADAPRRPLWRDLLLGGVGMACIGVAAYSVWAFGHRWFSSHGGDALLYPAVAAVYLLLPGLVLHPLAEGRRRFLAAYVPALLAYAAAWCAAYFLVKVGGRDVLASAAGSLAFAGMAAAVFRRLRAVPPAALLLFVLHSAGYFAGEAAFARLGGATGMLAWGFLHGLGFGAGLAWTFRLLR